MSIFRSLLLLLCCMIAPLGNVYANSLESAVEHTVRPGDTLSRIARDVFGTNDYRAIAKANDIANPNRIYPGMVIRSGRNPSPVAKATPSHDEKCEVGSTNVLQTGVASWYGGTDGYHGKRTANGETYNMHGKTAAHPTLPFGTMVCVVNPANGKSAVARINDRGPFKKGRIIDVSYRIADELGIAKSGVGVVHVSTLPTTSQHVRTDARTPPSLRKAPDATHKDTARVAQPEQMLSTRTQEMQPIDFMSEVVVTEFGPAHVLDGLNPNKLPAVLAIEELFPGLDEGVRAQLLSLVENDKGVPIALLVGDRIERILTGEGVVY